MYTNTDYHQHFTGSLPIKYLILCQNKKLNKNLDLENFELIRQELLNFLQRSFDQNTQNNIENFFNIYSKFQKWTKGVSKEEIQNLYVEGSSLISENNYKDGLDNFAIIAGPLSDWDSTKLWKVPHILHT